MRSKTSFEFDGDLILIEALIVGPSRQAEVRLVLDTGAVLTTLVPKIAESIGYTSAARVARSIIRSAVAEEHVTLFASHSSRRSASHCLMYT